MTELKDQMLQLIQHDAARKASEFASQLARVALAEKEQILAGLDFEKWLEQTCRECLK
ncbi:hypothetical protein ACFL5F_08715 [Planctomycetota bacterium]